MLSLAGCAGEFTGRSLTCPAGRNRATLRDGAVVCPSWHSCATRRGARPLERRRAGYCSANAAPRLSTGRSCEAVDTTPTATTGAARPTAHQVGLEAIRETQEFLGELAWGARLGRPKNDATDKRGWGGLNRVDGIVVRPGASALRGITQFAEYMRVKPGPRWEGLRAATKVTRASAPLRRAAEGKKPTTAPHVDVKKYK